MANLVNQKTQKQQNSRNENVTRFFEDCSIRAVEGEGNERKFSLSFSSEEPYDRWWGREILSHADGAVDLTRLNTIGCVLFNHDYDQVIGRIVSAWIKDNRGEAEIEFDDDEASEIIRKKVQSKTLRGVSVGYVVSEWEDVKKDKTSGDGRFKGPCSIGTKWMPYEISIVSVPADATVGVGRSLEDEPETTGVSSFYFYEKQLQINNNVINNLRGGN